MVLSTKIALAPVTKPTSRNPVTYRRTTLLRGIDKQMMIVKDMMEGISVVRDDITNRKRPTWFWLDESGKYFLNIKHGKSPIELEKGKFSIVCNDLEHVFDMLELIRDLVQRGELDSQLEKSSQQIRKNFNK